MIFESESPQPTSQVAHALLSDDELSTILGVTTDWVRAHAAEIPGLQRLGSYYRFLISPVDKWLGGLDPLLDAEEIAPRLKVPVSWVYANATQIPGFIRLGRYIRFRPAIFARFIGGSEACS
ncbi:hypothetical protein [Occallatibacter savannae]|uniref:hypothetical protein n=1 Tax=Occallatibacter savannae TaxID=1002691 RepID=UPI0013A56F2A|nr:hypothetical protein [Occallatibacter savannae]